MGGCGDCSRVLLGLASCLVGWVSLLLAPAGCLAAVARVLRLLLVLWSWGALPRCWLRAWCWVLLWWLLLRASGFLLPCGRLRVFAACFGAARVAAPLVSGYSAPLPLVVVRYSFGCSLGVVVVGVRSRGVGLLLRSLGALTRFGWLWSFAGLLKALLRCCLRCLLCGLRGRRIRAVCCRCCWELSVPAAARCGCSGTLPRCCCRSFLRVVAGWGCGSGSGVAGRLSADCCGGCCPSSCC